MEYEDRMCPSCCLSPSHRDGGNMVRIMRIYGDSLVEDSVTPPGFIYPSHLVQRTGTKSFDTHNKLHILD